MSNNKDLLQNCVCASLCVLDLLTWTEPLMISCSPHRRSQLVSKIHPQALSWPPLLTWLLFPHWAQISSYTVSEHSGICLLYLDVQTPFVGRTGLDNVLLFTFKRTHLLHFLWLKNNDSAWGPLLLKSHSCYILRSFYGGCTFDMFVSVHWFPALTKWQHFCKFGAHSLMWSNK